MNKEIDKFKVVSKRILKENISVVPATLIKYKEDIVDAYIAFVNYCSNVYNSLQETDDKPKQDILSNLNYIANKFEECLIKLNCKYNISESLFELPDIDTIKIIGIEIDETVQEEELSVNNNPNNGTMVITTPEFLKLSSATINYRYAGDPLGLPSFIDSIKLLESLATEETLKTLLVSFVKSKLDGKAREYVDDSHDSIQSIITALKANIKPDNSKVVEGRMLALRLGHNTQDEFAQKVEELSESLRRSLIIEGISATKATEMAIEKTIDLCRSQTKNEIVKAVLESSTFTSTKDVVAKLLTQNDKAKKEHQVLVYRANRNQAPNQNRSNNNNRGRGRGNHNNNNSNRGSHNDQYNRNSHSNNNSHNNGHNHQNNNRGRGRGSYNNYNNRGSRNEQYNRNSYFNNNPQNNGQYVRMVSRDEPGNAGVPQQFLMGATEH